MSQKYVNMNLRIFDETVVLILLKTIHLDLKIIEREYIKQQTNK